MRAEWGRVVEGGASVGGDWTLSCSHEWTCWQRKHSEHPTALMAFLGVGDSVCPSLLGHDDLIFLAF